MVDNPIEFDESIRERLRAVPLFAQLEDEDLDRLAGLSRVLHLDKKKMLFNEGEPYRGMFVILSGLAVVYKLGNDGRMLILQVCRPGDSLAEVPLFEEADAGYPAYGKVTRAGEVLFLPHERFVPFLKQHPEVAWEMLDVFAARIKELALQLEGVTLRPRDGPRDPVADLLTTRPGRDRLGQRFKDHHPRPRPPQAPPVKTGPRWELTNHPDLP